MHTLSPVSPPHSGRKSHMRRRSTARDWPALARDIQSLLAQAAHHKSMPDAPELLLTVCLTPVLLPEVMSMAPVPALLRLSQALARQGVDHAFQVRTGVLHLPLHRIELAWQLA